MVSLLSNSDTEIQDSHFCRGAQVGTTYSSINHTMVPHHTGYNPFVIDTDGLSGWWDSLGGTADIHDKLKNME